MRVYIAGYLNFVTDVASADVTKGADVNSVLESYFYFTPPKVRLVQQNRHKWAFLLDSGAFSAKMQKAEIDLTEYCDFIKRTPELWDIVATLDVIGNAQASWENYQKMLDQGVGDVCQLMPTFHLGSPWEELDRIAASGATYIAMGGLASQRLSDEIYKLLDIAWGEHLTNSDGTAKIKVHGFGITGKKTMLDYPWESVDSTAWLQMAAHGTVALDMPNGAGGITDIRLSVSDQSPKVKDYDQHFDSMRPVWKTRIEQFLEDQGFKMEDLKTSYRWRQRVNLAYFKRCELRGTTKFVRLQPGLFV